MTLPGRVVVEIVNHRDDLGVMQWLDAPIFAGAQRGDPSAGLIPSVQDGCGTPRYNSAMNDTIILPPGGGRAYTIGAMRGVFKADEDAYCASEWSVEPGGSGPGAHSHEAQDEVFIVTEGMMWFLAGEDWVEAPAGTFLRIPAGVTHDFENRGAERATAFNVFIPGGGFEADFARWAS